MESLRSKPVYITSTIKLQPLERLDAEQRIMRSLRVECHAEVAKTDRNAVEHEGCRPEGLMEVQAVIGRLRLREGGPRSSGSSACGSSPRPGASSGSSPGGLCGPEHSG